jgi:hypothetical protein
MLSFTAIQLNSVGIVTRSPVESRLIVIAGGLESTRRANPGSLKRAVEEQLSKITGGGHKKQVEHVSEEIKHQDLVYVVKYDGKDDIGLWSQKDPEELSQQISEQIESQYRALAASVPESEPRPTISLITYSAGSLLMQRAMVESKRSNNDHWVDKVDSHIILSGITRGWQFTTATPPPIRFIGEGLRVLKTGLRLGSLFIWKLYRGSPFVTATRIEYSRYLRDSNIRCIYFLGSRDEFVTPSDCLEVVNSFKLDQSTQPVGGLYLELPGTTHQQILERACGVVDRLPRVPLINMIVDALLGSADFADEYQDYLSKSDDIDDYLDPFDATNNHRSDDSANHLVFILHGIRDQGFWAKRIAREIKKEHRIHHPHEQGQRSLRTITPSYGFFSMLQFLLPGGRSNALYWFLDQYADARIMYPNAESIDVIAHSNGTYLIAEALKECDPVKFRHVIFAGSVVRRDFWSQCRNIASAKLASFNNLMGRLDLIVGLLPGAMETIPVLNRYLNVGGAGAYGFIELPFAYEKSRNRPSFFNELGFGRQSLQSSRAVGQRMIEGGHGAGIQEACWKPIAEFIVNGSNSNESLNQIFCRHANSDQRLVRSERKKWESSLLGISRVLAGALIIPVLLFLLLFPLWYPALLLMDWMPLVGGFPAKISAWGYGILVVLVWILSKGLRYL